MSVSVLTTSNYIMYFEFFDCFSVFCFIFSIHCLILANCKSKTKLRGELYEKDGEKYLRYTDIEIKIQVGEGKVKLRKLFGGDKILSELNIILYFLLLLHCYTI